MQQPVSNTHSFQLEIVKTPNRAFYQIEFSFLQDISKIHSHFYQPDFSFRLSH